VDNSRATYKRTAYDETLDVVRYKMWTIRVPVNFTAYRAKLSTSREYRRYYIN